MNIHKTVKTLTDNGQEVIFLPCGGFIVDGKSMSVRSLIFAAKMVARKNKRERELAKKKKVVQVVSVNVNEHYTKPKKARA